MKKIIFSLFLLAFALTKGFETVSHAQDEYIGKEMLLNVGPFKFCKVKVEGYLGYVRHDIVDVIKDLDVGDLRLNILNGVFCQNFGVSTEEKENTGNGNACGAFSQKVFLLRTALSDYHDWCWKAAVAGREWHLSGDGFPIYYGTICKTDEYKNWWIVHLVQRHGWRSCSINDPINKKVCFNVYWLSESK